MNILALSGSARAASTNTAMLRALAETAPPRHSVIVFADLGALPVFSPDLDQGERPETVRKLAAMIAGSDGLIVASPEYARSIPGGLKNAIDWLVSGDELIDKPIALMHASHRGDDMLAQLRLVLTTVGNRFAPDLFLRFDLMALTPDAIGRQFQQPETRARAVAFLDAFALEHRR